MKNIRCLIADSPQIVLADIIHRIVESQSGIEVIGRVENNEDLPQLVHDRDIDLVIIGMASGKFPNGYNEMLDASPEIVIVGLVEDGRRAVILVNDVGPSELMDVVRRIFDSKETSR